jgi:hypothetical protein
MQNPILAPVIALVLWSFVMQAWMYATRIPAMKAARIKPDPRAGKALLSKLPPEVQWKADNYNHLMEQPTLFYAVAITLAVLGAGGGMTAGLAWLYVALRIAHSLVQATANVIMLRFAIFTLSSLVLLVLALRAAALVF